jgi:serine phosphatase RsbU (regulator of sigma subunit)/anti-sigma regulatory factor (Ser/Thr protein kinase)
MWSVTPSRRRGSARYELAARTAVARYGVAALLAVGAVVVARVLLPHTDGPLYSLQVGAVAVAVWYGGFGPGLLAAALGWSLSPLVMSQAGFGFEEQEIRWASSLVVALVVVWVSVVMRRAQARAATAAVAAEESTRQMAAIQELTTALSAAVTPTDVARELIRRTPPLLGARGGSLGLIEGDDVVIVDPAGIAPQTHRPGLRLSLERLAPITRAAAEGELKRAEDRTTLEARFPDGAALTPYAQAAIAVPLRAGGDVVGSLSFLFDRPQAAHEEAEAIALIAADLGGQALERARLYEREQRSREALDHLVRVSPRLYSGSAEEIRVEICREARGLLGTDMTEIWRVGADLQWLGLVCRDPEEGSQSGDERLRIDELRGLREAAETLEVVFAPDAEAFAHGDALQHVRTHGIRSWLWVPIPVGGQAQQLLFFSWQTALRETDPSTMLLARRFSDHAGVALEQLERRQAEEEAARRAVEVRRLLDSTAALSAATTPSEVTRAILQEGLRSLGASSGVVVCVTGDGDALEVVDSDGYRPETLEPWRVFPLDADAPLAEAARENRLVALESPEELAERFPALAQSRTESTSSWLSVPLTAAGSVLGAAGFSFAHARTFSEAELEFAEALGRQAGQALERALLLAAEYAARTRAEDMVALTSALSQAVSRADVLRAVESQISERISADTGIYLLEEGVGLELVETNGTSLGAGEPRLRRLTLDSGTPPAACAHRRRPVWVETDDEWSGYEDAETWRSAGVGRLGAVPLLVDGRLLGVLAVAFEPDGRIEAEVRALVESIARQTSHALERAWLMEREQAARVAAERASRRTRLLQSITQALAAAPAPHDVAEIIVREALAAVSGDAVALFAFDTASEAPKVLAEVGFGGDAAADDLAASVTDAALRGSLVVVDAESPVGLPENALRGAIAATGLRAAVCVPLGVGPRAIGALLVCFRAPDELSAEDTELVQTLARIGAQVLERSRLFDDEQRLRQRSERIQAMSESLSGSLTQRDVAEVVVDALVQGAGADAAAFSAVIDDRRVQKKLAWRGYDAEAQEPWLEIPLTSPTPGNAALRTGSVIFYETLWTLAADFPAAAERMRNTGHESFLFVPLVAGGRANGLVVTSWAERVTLDAEDRAFIETLAGLAAQALDRARLVESDRTIAETLQRSVLPVSLPLVPNVQLAARYLPGTDEVDVGGDWFDAIRLSNGRLGLAVGDVVGKGVQAAATMAQLRNGLRAFALDRMKPSSTIARLNRLSEEMSESTFATLVYAVLDPELGVCHFTSAGHPPPLVVRPDGRAEYAEGGRGLPLGTGPDVRYTQDRIDLPVGSTLILYTDGLVERRSEPIDVGLERLREAAESAAGNPERVVEHILARVVGGEGRGDDIAVLVVRLLAVAPKPLDLRLPTAPRSLDLVRDALRAWLEYAPTTQTEAHDVVLATWEACANAIEHPDRTDRNGRFGVRAELEESAVTVTVTDCGRWLAETERADRGLGLRLIEAVMTSVEIDVTDDGTSVRLEKELAGEDALALS